MKSLILITAMLFGTIVKAQLSELLSKTWNLEKVIVNGIEHKFPNSMPSIQPITTFTADTFKSRICNSLGAYVSYTNSKMNFISQGLTLGGCPHPSGADYDTFELYYFGQFFGGNLSGGFFKDYEYMIENLTNNLKLTLINPNGDKAIYLSVNLAVSDVSASDIKIYPNPVKERLSISVKDYDKKISIKILNMEGKEVYSKIFYSTKEISIDTSNFPSGVYLVKINNGLTPHTIKILKK